MVDDVILRVSGQKSSDYTKRVSGAICWRIREVGVCLMRAVKSEAASTAVKAVAIANEKVAQADVILAIDPVLDEINQSDGIGEESMALAMVVQEPTFPRPESAVELKVSGSPDSGMKGDQRAAARLAGAIASEVRKGNATALRCIGSMAVYKAIRAVALAKGYLFTNGISIQAIPTWISLEQGDASVSAIVIEVWGKKDFPACQVD